MSNRGPINSSLVNNIAWKDVKNLAIREYIITNMATYIDE